MNEDSFLYTLIIKVTEFVFYYIDVNVDHYQGYQNCISTYKLYRRN